MRRKLGEMHPYTLAAAVNRANCFGDAGEFAAAEGLECETISRLERVLGPDHPDTLICRANLVVTLRGAGREQEAKEQRAKILSDFSKVLGTGHPDAVQLREGQRINRDLEPQPF
jgi:hypothetical protein